MQTDGFGGTRLLGLIDENQYRRVLARMLDENEFLSPYGIRSMSRYHLDHPYVFPPAVKIFACQYAAGGVGPASSAEIRTGADRSGCPSTCSSSGRSLSVSILR